jgi:hypothetical protein
MTCVNVDCADQTRVPHRHFSQHSPRQLTVVALTALLFLAPGRAVGAASFGGGQGGLDGGHMGGGNAGHGRAAESRGGGARGELGGGGDMDGRTLGRGDFRGHRFEQRRLHDSDDDLGFFIYPYPPYYGYEPDEPGYFYDPYCNEYSPSYDPQYCDSSP